MKIAIGFKIVQGPWGGGNFFAKNLSSYLLEKGWEVVYDLKSKDIDLILLADPRENSSSSSFNHMQIRKYKKKHPHVIIVHRINECDERKGTNIVNKTLMLANEIADHTIFISNWLQNLFKEYKDFNDFNSTVIRNGADNNIFNNRNYSKWDKKNPIKLVTHHWSGNWMKGFDIYSILDGLHGTIINGAKVEFTFIGNIPDGFYFQNSKRVLPLYDEKLAQELQRHHIYITGSQNEPGGMHHIEGCLCGLPPVYRKSGAITEHCNGFGVGFNNEYDFQEALAEMINKYDYFSEVIHTYPYNTQLMCNKYEELFLKLLRNKQVINNKVNVLLFKKIKNSLYSHLPFK